MAKATFRFSCCPFPCHGSYVSTVILWWWEAHEVGCKNLQKTLGNLLGCSKYIQVYTDQIVWCHHCYASTTPHSQNAWGQRQRCEWWMSMWNVPYSKRYSASFFRPLLRSYYHVLQDTTPCYISTLWIWSKHYRMKFSISRTRMVNALLVSLLWSDWEVTLHSRG